MITSGRKSMGTSVWPGYVDALSALLMVVIFVLLIFTISQFLLSQALMGKESELTTLHTRFDELVRLLGLEEEKSQRLTNEYNRLSTMITDLTQERETLYEHLNDLSRQSEQDAQTIKEQLLMVGSLQEDIDALQRLRRDLESQVGKLSAELNTQRTEAGISRDRSMALEARLADEEERTLLAQQSVEARDIRIQALAAVVGDQKKALSEERRLSQDARAEIALLSQQITNLKKQLEQIGQALQIAEKEKKAQTVELAELGKRLNIVLAQQVNELQRYRSEFYGRLNAVLGDNPYVKVEGDRFVLQAELLFESGSAELGVEGRVRLSQVADVLLDLSKKIPADINWILRIDGHTDRVPINTKQFKSNWELSTARAVSVVRFLGEYGFPEDRMAATGFSQFHPIDSAQTPEAYRMNRRIEMKLTSR